MLSLRPCAEGLYAGHRLSSRSVRLSRSFLASPGTVQRSLGPPAQEVENPAATIDPVNKKREELRNDKNKEQAIIVISETDIDAPAE